MPAPTRSMVSIVTLPLAEPGIDASWAEIANTVSRWFVSHAVEPRDAVVLLPFGAAAALGAARLRCTWRPAPPHRDDAYAGRIAPARPGPTPLTRRRSTRLSTPCSRARCSQRKTGARPGGATTVEASIVRRVGLSPPLTPLCALVQAWLLTLATRGGPPCGRPSAPAPAPAAGERALARISLEWAALAPPPDTDRLFALRPAAWVSVQAGGSDKLVTALLERAAAPCLVIDTDLVADIDRRTVLDAPAVAVCDGFEQEAQAAAAQVLAHLAAGERPVALVAADRVVVRRVRALLERTGARLLDETGWRLSTTRAAAAVMSLLVARRASVHHRSAVRVAEERQLAPPHACDRGTRNGVPQTGPLARRGLERSHARRPGGRRGAPLRPRRAGAAAVRRAAADRGVAGDPRSLPRKRRLDVCTPG